MSLVGTAKETLEIIERGWYAAPSGKRVEVRSQVDAAVAGTVLYRPADLQSLMDGRAPTANTSGGATEFQVTPETTAQAARRLVESEGLARVLTLNFASAKNPGGGFLRGAKAQEEDLARCSALYTCQLQHRAYYEANRATPSMLYTDHLIYSPDVPFFRDDGRRLLEAPFLVSIITSPAPNAGEELGRNPDAGSQIHAALESRAGHILAVAAQRSHRHLVLGAWGCGVFRNQPADVASVFHSWLNGRFRGAFERVVFAIYDRARDQSTLRAFQDQFRR
jgi:uncharacterized protein (TIGR02452 family)